MGLRTRPRTPGTPEPSLPQPREDRREGALEVLAGGGGDGYSGCQALRAQHSSVPTPPPPAGCRSLALAAGSQPRPPALSRLSTSTLPSAQPMANKETNRATHHATNRGGPLGGQPPGIGQLPAASALARLLFVNAAPISLGPHPTAVSQASLCWAR